MRVVILLLLSLSMVACDRPERSQSAQQKPAVPPPQLAAASSESLVELSSAQIVTPELSGACNLEAIDGVVVPDAKPIEAKTRRISVSGWLVDDTSKRIPEVVQLRLASQAGDGRVWQQALLPTAERLDVQKLQGGSPEVLKAGFSGSVDTSSLPPGRYALRLAYDRAGKEIVCDNGRGIILK
jgi:hypothetical protein